MTYHEGIVERSEDVGNGEVFLTLLLGNGGDLLNSLFLLSISLLTKTLQITNIKNLSDIHEWKIEGIIAPHKADHVPFYTGCDCKYNYVEGNDSQEKTNSGIVSRMNMVLAGWRASRGSHV